MKKTYIDAQQLLCDSHELAFRVLDSGFRPDLIIGVWRGGTPVGIALQEVLEFSGMDTDHIAIRTASYSGIDQRGTVKVDGLEYIERRLSPELKLLLVDDVYDTGLSVQAVIEELQRLSGARPPEIRVATPYFKPANNRTGRKPDYYLHTSDDWLVFPHELMGLSEAELSRHKPGIDKVKKRLLGLMPKEKRTASN